MMDHESESLEPASHPSTSHEWADQQGNAWRLELAPDVVHLAGNGKSLSVSADAWSRDIYVVPHGESYIIRIDTFDVDTAFVVPRDRAAPLLAHIGWSDQPQPPPAAEEVTAEANRSDPLLWPKVSPLAVWALISSSLVFVPLLGCIPAIATVVLLVLHRRNVRRSRAWDHSRSLCTAAFVFLILGAIVSLLATLGLARDVALPAVSLHTPGAGTILRSTEGDAAQEAGVVGQGGIDRLEHINWGLLAAALIVVLLSLTVHEAAHAITAWWLGDDFARQLGRVTLSPLAHIDPFGTVILPIVLYLFGGAVFGWARPVPVRTETLARRHRAHILISIAGPGSNLLLAAASLALLLGLGAAITLWAPDAQVSNFSTLEFSDPVTASGFPLAILFGPVCLILKLSFMVNVLLAFFNLIPIPPLDGSWVLEHMFPRTFGPFYAKIRPFGFLIFLGLIYSGTKILFYMLTPAFILLWLGFDLLGLCTTLA